MFKKHYTNTLYTHYTNKYKTVLEPTLDAVLERSPSLFI